MTSGRALTQLNLKEQTHITICKIITRPTLELMAELISKYKAMYGI